MTTFDEMDELAAQRAGMLDHDQINRRSKVESILSMVMDKLDHAKKYDYDELVISYSELEEILDLYFGVKK